MRFEWDEDKDRTNQRKHGVPFGTAVLVFDDPHVFLFLDRVQNGEERWQAIDAVQDALLLTVVHTYRDADAAEVTRIISARAATRYEVGLYVKNYYGE